MKIVKYNSGVSRESKILLLPQKSHECSQYLSRVKNTATPSNLKELQIFPLP